AGPASLTRYIWCVYFGTARQIVQLQPEPTPPPRAGNSGLPIELRFAILPAVPHHPPHREEGQLLPLHAAVRPAGWHARPRVLGAAEEEQSRDGRGAGLRVPGARGGRDAVDARAIRDADLRLHALRRAGLPAAALAHRAPLHVHGLGLVQDLHHLLLPPPRQAPPDLGRPQIRLPLFPAVRQGRHQRPDRAGHPEGRENGRQSRQPCSSEQERGTQRRRHAVREQAPGPPRARRPRQHPHGRGHPQRDPQGHHRGLHDRRHLQARQGHRALPLQEEDPRHDDDAVDGEVPEDPEGGGGGGPAVPGAGHQVPVGGAVQDVDRRQVAVAAGAAVGVAGHALPPVRGAPHPRLPPGLHLRQARRHAPPQGRPGPRLLRVLAGARGGARLPRRRSRALPRGVRAPRGGRHRRRPHRRRLGGGAQARHPARL
uniref:Uncharacterized protein n=1 Tax=Aegilops tauschii subsp. strangulata TaxID=200361 RepID=A0A453KW90_AEGTS